MLKQQLKIEDEAYDIATIKAASTYYKATEDTRGSETNEGVIFIRNTIAPVASKLAEYLNSKHIRGVAYSVREPIMDYKGNEETLAYIILSSIFNLTLVASKYEPYSMTLSSVARKILASIKQEYKLEQFRGQAPRLNKYVDEKYKKLSVRRRTNKKMILGRKKMELGEPDNQHGLTLGINLIDVVIKSGCGLCEVKHMRIGKRKNRAMLHLTEATQNIISNMRDLSPLFAYSYPIFVIPPKPWTEFSGSGGYYNDYLSIDLVKVSHDKKNRKMVKGYFDAHPEFVKRYTNIVNSVQATPWKINTKILKVLQEVYDKHLTDYREDFHLLGKIVTDDLPKPYDLIEPVPYDKDNVEPYVAYRDKLMKLEDKFDTFKSQSLIIKLAMSKARTYSKYDKIYYSYQVDFRGRLYPIQPHLNPQGTKVVKSLLLFAEGKPLDTPEAIKWFKIHGANLYGYDKLLYHERIQKVEEMYDEICKIAQDPLVNTQWTDADEPYPYLAWCFECATWINNPDSFISHIPIALDATCSGIQIYSGLMRDNKGAEAVNVVNHNGNTIIADIYRDVAGCVNKYLELGDYNDSIQYTTSDGVRHDISCSSLASSMVGKIDRKITKRNVMTFPYNVSAFGMKDQLLEDILNDYEDTDKQFWTGEKWVTALFLSRLNYKGIEETVKGAVVCRDFLKSLTKEVIDMGDHIFYRTPLFGFPVVHRIVKYDNLRVKTALAKLTIRTPTTVLDSKRMINGIAPNYIHSLDATLMFRTVERLLEQGVTSFALIHDSYGVHAADTEKLAREVREAYIELFTDNVLYDFVEQTAPFKALEARGILLNDLDLQEVRDSDYIFS